MNQVLLFIFLLLISEHSFTQNKGELKEKESWTQLESTTISQSEWFLKIKSEGGHLSESISAWYKKESKIETPMNKGTYLIFKKNPLRIAKNGNVYWKMVLVNDRKRFLEIQRIDATIGGIQEFCHIDGKWFSNRKNGSSDCGNSYSTDIIGQYRQIEFELNNDGLTEGEIELDYNIAITIEDKSYELISINVKLYDSQYERLREKLGL